MIYKVTVYYDFIHYGSFMKGSNDIILESWDIIYWQGQECNYISITVPLG